MAALPTICLSALRALIHGADGSPAAPSSVQLTSNAAAQPSSSSSSPGTTYWATSRSVEENLCYKEADEKSREVGGCIFIRVSLNY